MNMKLITVILITSLLLSGCGNINSQTELENETISKTEEDIFSTEKDESTESENDVSGFENIESLGHVETEKGLFNVEMTLPPEFVGEINQEELDALTSKKGFISAQLNNDGSVTYIMTKKKHKELLEETRVSFAASIENMIGSDDYPNIVSIEANSNFTEFTVVTKNDEISFTESFVVMSFYMMAGMYGVFSGEEVDNINVMFINESTGEIISEANSSDME